MKILGIGDLLIPAKYIASGFRLLAAAGHTVETIEWKLEDYEELQNINLRVEVNGSEAYAVPEEIIEAAKDADIVITQFCPITKRFIDACDKLKLIGVLRSGCENIHLEYATEKGIFVCNTPGRNANAVADFTVGMMISECRNIAKSHKNLKEGKWIRDYKNAATVPDLPEKTAGIIGFGQIGRKIAQRLHGFEMRILAYDPYARDVPDYVTLVTLEELARQSDFVTLHARLCKDTERMINARLLKLMKKDAYFINTARSGLVDEQALYEALKSGEIMGAALDVFDVEPPPQDYPLVGLDNVTITPHLAGGTIDAFTNSPKLLAAKVLRILTKNPSLSLVNQALWKTKNRMF